MMSRFPTSAELAAEAREALASLPPQSSEEHFQQLVRLGWINARGQVTKFLGGVVDPEPDYQTWTRDRDRPRKKKKAK